MGNWEEESSALLVTQNEGNVAVPSNGTHHDKNDGDGNGDGDVEIVDDAGHDRRESEVMDEDALVEKLERVQLQNNGGDDSKFGEEHEEQGEGEDDEDGKLQFHPLRPYAADCSFYIKTGTCKFGPNCRYNHTSKRDFQPVADIDKGFEASNGAVYDTGTTDCKYFLMPGGCKYGDACRYRHSTPKIDAERLLLNFLGLPIRPSVQDCTFYLRNGSCGYGTNCRFNHPDPGVAKELEPRNSPSNGISGRGATSFPRNYVGEPSKSFEASHGTSDLSNGINLRNGLDYAPEMSSYHRAIPQSPGWNQKQVFSSYPANKGHLPHQNVNIYSKTPDPAVHYEKLMQIEEFPERPGQPDCAYFMKTGDCKYRSACRYNHPMSRASKLRLPTLSPKGLYSRPATVLPMGSSSSELSNLSSNNMRKNGMSSLHFQEQQVQNGEFPEQPGQPECEYYMKTGQCKFKTACRYHHPRNQVSSSLPCVLSEKGLPIRPGTKLCRNYEQQGTCKYGHNCLFNHPDEYSTTAQVAAQVLSSTNVPVAANLDSSAPNNAGSGWDDGWEM